MFRKIIILLWIILLPGLGQAEIKPEPMPPSVILPAEPDPHWVWVNDIVFHHMADGKAYLVDGDSGEFLGMLSTGVGFIGLVLPSDYSQIYSPETYFSRGTRGERTDVISHLTGFLTGIALGAIYGSINPGIMVRARNQWLLGTAALALVAVAWAIALGSHG